MAIKKYYSTEECNLAKSVTLFDFLSRSYPADIKKIHGDEYTLESDPYLHFHENNPMWISYDAGKGGGSTALKYLMTHRDLAYPQAVGTILDAMNIPGSCSFPKRAAAAKPAAARPEDKQFVLPPKEKNYRRVFAYLSQKRAIDKEIIEELMKTGRLYEEADKHNCVFVGNDFDGNPVYGMRRGTGTERFVGDVKNSSKAFAFSLYLEGHDTLVVCESPVDVLSFASMVRLRGADHRSFAYTSLSGIYTPSAENEGKLPVTMENILDHFHGIRKLILCLDGDSQGQQTTDYLERILTQKGYEVSSVRLTDDMDINDLLVRTKSFYSQIGGKSQ